MTMIALVDVDLRRGEADARRGVHGFGHVADQLDDLGRDRGHRRRHLAQPRIGILENMEQHVGRYLAKCRLGMQNPS